MNDAAAAASKIVGRPVTTKVLPFDAVVPTLAQVGLSPNVAGLFREMLEAFAKGHAGWEAKGRSVTGKVPLADVLRRGLA